MSSTGMKELACRGARHGWLFACFAVALGAAGCTVQTTDPGPPVVLPPPADIGSLTLRWTVNGTTDPNTCLLGGATTFDVSLTTTSGQFAGQYQASCGAFATNISNLAADTYGGAARLLDGAGRARTTTIDIDTFNILGNSSLIVDLDFPANSFY